MLIVTALECLFVVALVCALGVILFLSLRGCGRFLRHIQFGLLELLLLIAVICGWCAALRSGWDSVTIAPMLLFFPPSLLAI